MIIHVCHVLVMRVACQQLLILIIRQEVQLTMNLIISQTHNNNDTLTLFKVEMSNTQIAENLKHNYFLEVGKRFLSSNTNSISIITHRI